MRTLLLACAVLVAIPFQAWAQDHSGHGQMDHSQHGAVTPAPSPAPPPQVIDHSQHGAPTPAPSSAPPPQVIDHSQHGAAPNAAPVEEPPPRALEGPLHAADAFFGAEAMARAREASRTMHGGMNAGTLLVERFEARLGDGTDGYQWDVSGWYGSATDRLVVKSEGEGEFGGAVEETELQLLWGHAIDPWFDLQVGLRADAEPDTRAHLSLGVAGLAPYNVHLDAALFLSDRGDLTARIEAEHDMRLTQRLILQPRAEVELAAQDVPERGVGAGLHQLSLGARLRYEVAREFAPYLGAEYTTGDEADAVALLLGIRTWF